MAMIFFDTLLLLTLSSDIRVHRAGSQLKNQNDTLTMKDVASQRIKLISESTQYFFMIFFLNWKVISSRPSFQLSSHLEYVFILKKNFKNYFYPDKVCSLLLTVSIWPF